MNVQIIERNGTPEYAVIPMDEFKQLTADAEMLADISAYNRAKREMERGEDETIPADVVTQLLDGTNPIAVWRKHRQLTQTALAQTVGVKQAAIAQLETGKRTPSVKMIQALSRVLDVDMALLVNNDA